VGTNAQKFIEPLLERFREVVYVLGNHEYYHNDVEEVTHFWEKAMDWGHNLSVLNPGTVDFGDIRIVGATLWTDTLSPLVQRCMNDYHIIYTEGRTLTVKDTREFHWRDLNFSRAEVEEPYAGKTIVVTHHAPIKECVAPKWENSLLNPGFHAHCNKLIEENDIDLWIHGHMHDTIHFTYEDTEIYCNPRGYAGPDSNAHFREDFVLNLGGT